MEDQGSRWDGMSDGDTETVECPFGEAVFMYESGDRSVGINPGVLVVELIVGGVTFDRDALEKTTTVLNGVTYTLAERLDRWADTE
jgi:hypothetical protein